jgi:hypothetical protein
MQLDVQNLGASTSGIVAHLLAYLAVSVGIVRSGDSYGSD